MVHIFFINEVFLSDLNDTYQVLVPKREYVSKPEDFRPISLCNVSYKIITKLLSSRLRLILPNLISPWQETFILGRNIHDNTIVAHEIVDYMKKKRANDGVIGVKLDMAKAFDKMEWCYLEKVMSKIGFSSKWCRLIMKCISSPKISLMLNGATLQSFNPSRGLRKGDSISPYIFILGMEGFSRLLSNADRS